MTSVLPPPAVELLQSLSYPECASSALHQPIADEIILLAKTAAVERNDQAEATLVWQARTILSIQRGFIAAFSSLKSYKFYEAWCQLERCEIEISGLRRYYTPNDEDTHRIDYIERMILRWQNLYPYKVFFSPEILKKKVVCSICGETISLRQHCGHEKFGIYDGEPCYHRVEDAEFLSISIVENPVQRYSVAFLAGDEPGKSKDHYNYGNIRFVVDRVDSPFNGWEAETTTRTLESSDVAHLVRDDPCPCVSGKAFGECCAGKAEIVVPHLQIRLYVQPSTNLPENELLI